MTLWACLTLSFGRSGHVTHACAYGFLTKGGGIEDSRSLLKLLLCCTNLLSGALLPGKGWGRKARMGTSWLQRVFIDSIWVPSQRMSAKAKRVGGFKKSSNPEWPCGVVWVKILRAKHIYSKGEREWPPRKQQKVEYLSNRSRFFGFNTDWSFGNLRCAFVLSNACSTKEFFPVQFGLHLTVGIKPSGINRFGLHFCDQSIFCKCCKWNERRRKGGWGETSVEGVEGGYCL